MSRAQPSARSRSTTLTVAALAFIGLAVPARAHYWWADDNGSYYGSVGSGCDYQNPATTYFLHDGPEMDWRFDSTDGLYGCLSWSHTNCCVPAQVGLWYLPVELDGYVHHYDVSQNFDNNSGHCTAKNARYQALWKGHSTPPQDILNDEVRIDVSFRDGIDRIMNEQYLEGDNDPLTGGGLVQQLDNTGLDGREVCWDYLDFSVD